MDSGWQWFDYDPYTGITEWFRQDSHTGAISIHYSQNVEPIMDFCKELANSAVTDGNFRGEGFLVAALPMIAIMKMREKGFNALKEHGPEGTKYLLKEIKTNYPFFLTTHKRII